MQIVISILVILFVLLVLYIMWVYNGLIRLQINRDNALADIAHDLDKLFIALDEEQHRKKKSKKAINARADAEDMLHKIEAFNLLQEHVEELAKDKKTQIYITQTLAGRRYYNHATKLVNAKLNIFPSNII